MKTRIQKLLVCAALVGAATLAQAQFDYTNNGNGTCTITGYYGDDGALSIPDSLDGLIVISIGEGAFSIDYNNSGGELTSVTIPNTVSSIGVGAFESCYSLTSVTLGSGVTSIGDYAFQDCTSLTSVTIPASVTNIGYSAFYFCISLTSVTIPASVTDIGRGVFSYCTSLTSVTIPASVTNIGSYAFEVCSSLTSVTLGSGVTSIGDHAFYACTSLTAITVDAANSFYSSVDGVIFDKNQTTLIAFPGGRAGSYTIPASVTSIGDEAFFDCQSLTGVTLGSGVTSIGDGAFYACTSLTNVTFGNGVTSIGNAAFYGCTSLTSVTIPASVSGIGDGAFEVCSSLTSVTLGSGVTSIGDHAFYACTSLTSVTIPNSVTSIGSYAFGYCTSLTAAYFLGNAPLDPGDMFNTRFGLDPVIIYYLPGATGWGPFFSRVPTELWNPQASAPRVTGGHFGFNITGPSNTVIVVEACTNLAQPVWLPVSTNALGGSGAASFSDSQSGNYPARFYRFRSP